MRTYDAKAPRYKYTRGMARNLLKVWPALWTFATCAGVQPTNYPEVRVMPRSAGLGALRHVALAGSSA